MSDPFMTINDQHFRISQRPSENYRAKSRAYVFGPGDGDDINSQVILGPMATLVGAPSIYTKRGEFPTLDKAWDALNAEIVARKRVVLNAALGEKALGALYSRTAGCRCGCSPGFILASRNGQDYFISEVKVSETKEVA
jgi:hypothetical protein